MTEEPKLPLKRVNAPDTVEAPPRAPQQLLSMTRSVVMAGAVMGLPLLALHNASAQSAACTVDSSGDTIGDTADPGDCVDCTDSNGQNASAADCQDDVDNVDYEGIKDANDYNPADRTFDTGDSGGGDGGGGGGGDSYYE